MKTILIIALIAMIMTGLATADADMTIYDRNNDGMIDAEERITLDIDIEDCRISEAEAYVINSYTTDGTIILNEEFRLAFLNPDANSYGAVATVTVTTTPVATPVTTPVTTPEADVGIPDSPPVISTVQPPLDDANSNMTILFVVAALVIIGLVAYLYTQQQKKE